MRAWIRRLIASARDFPGPNRAAFTRGAGFTSGPVTHVASRERFRIVVVRGRPADVCEDCAAPCHWLALEFRSDDDVWEPLLVVHESNLASIRDAVADVETFLARPTSSEHQEQQ